MSIRATSPSDERKRGALGAGVMLAPTGRAWGTTALTAGAIFLLVLVSYAPIIRAGFIWDDDSYVTANSTLRSLDGLRRIWCEIGAVPQYYPLVHSTFWVEYHLWGLSPLGYHLVNVLLHATSAVLLWRLLARLQVPGAWLAAALFAVHPVEVESVAWITERKNVLSLTLALASLLSYLRFAPLDGDETAHKTSGARWSWYGLALVLFTGALLSKTVVATLPAVVLVLVWWKRGRITVADVLPLVPFFAVGIGLGLVTVWMEQHHVGATGAEWNYTPLDRVLIAGRVLWFYAAKIVWPQPLVFFYPRWQIDAHAWWQAAFPVSSAATIVGLWLVRGQAGRGPLAGVLIFAGVLAPALGFFNVFPMRFSFVADHFQYHASVALIALLAAGATRTAWRLASYGRGAVAMGASIVVAALMALSYRQAGIYENLETLYRATIAGNPRGPTAYTNLGVYLSALGRYEEAMQLARDAVERGPDEAASHNNLGVCLLRRGSQPAADLRQLDEAVIEFQRAIELLPTFVDARVNLAAVLTTLKRPDEATEQLRRALEQDPNHVEAHYALAGILATGGQLPEAIAEYRAALTLRPDYDRAWNNLGVVLINSGETDEAVRCFEEAVRLTPDYAEAQANLAQARLLRNERSPTQQRGEGGP